MATRVILGTIAAGTVVTAAETIVPLSTPAVKTAMVGLNVTAVSGTSPSLQPYLEVLGSDNVWYQVWKPSAITAAGQSLATIGPDSGTECVWSSSARLRLEVTGTTPSFTMSATVLGL